MATSPWYYVNSPASGTIYYAPLWAGCIPNSGTSWTAEVATFSGANGTGSLVVCSSQTAYDINYTTATVENSFTASSSADTKATSSLGSNGSNVMHPAGQFSGGGVGSIGIRVSAYTGSAYVPSVSGFSPSQGGPGTSVTITGNHFVDATYVQFNGVAASSFTVNSMTQITAIVPSGATVGHITVGNPASNGSSASNYTPYNTPSVTSFSPSVGAPGTSVTISGSGFTGATSVTFNGTSVASFTVTSDTAISTSVPSGATAGPIAVTNPAGTGTSAGSFTPGEIYYGDASGSGAVHQPVAVWYGDASGNGTPHKIVACYINTTLHRIW